MLTARIGRADRHPSRPARLRPLRSKGWARPLHAIEEAELPSVTGKRVLHLQCHFGADSLRLAQRGAEVVGLDFSGPAIDAARKLASELGLADRACFVQANIYDTLQAIQPPHGFDMVFVTWGAITWLPDIKRWTEIVAAMLRSGGLLYLADGHPIAYVFDDAARSFNEGMPGLFAPYFSREPVVTEDLRDYIDPETPLVNSRTYNWIHPLGHLVTSLIASGLTLDWLHEHEGITWQMFKSLVKDSAGLYRWPDKPWLPLAFSLTATRR